MPPLETITLHLTASSIEAYCSALARRSATLEKRVAALDALITFIATQADAGEQAKAEFSAIRQTLHAHFELAHAALLAERTERLQLALSSHHLPAITTLYTSLSRDAYWTLLGRVVERLEAGPLSALRSWAAGWMMATEQRAGQATPYPDAIDFGAAGIDATEYLAMSDLCRYLGVEIGRA